jgi:hypothetical protein
MFIIVGWVMSIVIDVLSISFFTSRNVRRLTEILTRFVEIVGGDVKKIEEEEEKDKYIH